MSKHIIGFDISKDTIDCQLLKSNNNSYHLKQANASHGFLAIHHWIKHHKIRKPHIIMEATGIYYEQAAAYFAQFYTVHVVNPLKIKQHAQRSFSRTKTDKADALLIADYGKRFIDKLTDYTPPSPQQQRLQQLNQLYEQIAAELKRHKNQHHAAQDDYVCQFHHKQIQHLQQQLVEIDAEIHRFIQSSSELQSHLNRLQTIPSIKSKTARTILQYLLGRHFDTVNKLTAYAGLSPQIIQSGSSVNQPSKLTRLGHMGLKSALFMPALSAMKSKHFAPFVARLKAKGKPKKVIVVALMRKLLQLAYYIYKTEQPFDADYGKNKAAQKVQEKAA